MIRLALIAVLLLSACGEEHRSPSGTYEVQEAPGLQAPTPGE